MQSIHDKHLPLFKSLTLHLPVTAVDRSLAFVVTMVLVIVALLSNPACGPSPTPANSTPTVIPVTRPSPTPSVTPTDLPVTPNTHTPTFTNTPTPTPTVTTPATPTLSLTSPPPPPPTTQVPPPFVRPELIAPSEGGTYKNSITFQWSGSLRAGQVYQVTAYHENSGYLIQSEPLATPSWTVDLPKELVGAWYWRVSVVKGGSELTTTSEWLFYFDPSGGNGEHTATATPEHK